MEVLLGRGGNMRDKVMGTKYFEEFITQQENRILRFSKKLDRGEIKEDRILVVKKKMVELKYSVFESGYSKGKNLEELRMEFLEIVREMPQFWNATSNYLDMLWILSIAIMFEIDGEEWDILLQSVYSSGIDDWLLGFLAASRGGRQNYSEWKIRMSNPYERLKEIILHSEKKVEDIRDYLENKWYNAHKEMAWYDIHKCNEKLYSGYWSFESGAIAKILNIEDSSLKNVSYYPYDLVHYKDNKY